MGPPYEKFCFISTKVKKIVFFRINCASEKMRTETSAAF